MNKDELEESGVRAPGPAPAEAAPPPKVRAKNILLLIGPVLAGALVLLFAVAWLAAAWRGYQAARAVKAGLAPLLQEARSLKVNYEYAKSYPDKAQGKHALWCLRRQQGQAEAWYDGDPKKPLFILNIARMDAAPGGYRRDCLDTLVLIKSVKPYEFSPGKLRVEAEFVAYQ